MVIITHHVGVIGNMMTLTMIMIATMNIIMMMLTTSSFMGVCNGQYVGDGDVDVGDGDVDGDVDGDGDGDGDVDGDVDGDGDVDVDAGCWVRANR